MSVAIATLHRDLQSLVGKTIADRYRIDRLLGAGGMAAVFRAHHLGLKRDVAVKVLHPELTRQSDISARFDREARSASRLDHPNVVQVTDYGSTEANETSMKFMVMQLLEGDELTELLGTSLPPQRAVDLVLQILHGLDHAHRQGVVHRDVKPENVFITRDHDDREVLKLMDFGISKIVGGGDGDGHRTQVGLIFGTPAYMSPEQAAGLDADARADLYSVGVILYQLLSGRLPIDHEDAVSLVRMQISVDPEPLPSTVPPVLAAAVQRLLCKAREGRFQSAAEAIETFEAMIPMLNPMLDIVGGASSEPATPRVATAPHETTPSSQGPVSRVASRKGGTTASYRIAPMAQPVGSGAIVIGMDGRRGIDWRLAAGVMAAVMTIVVIVFAWPSSHSDAPDSAFIAAGATDSAGDQAATNNENQLQHAGPESTALDEIDRLLLAHKLADADKLIGPLLDEFPKNPELLWRAGRFFAKSRRKEERALAAYGDAIEVNRSLLDNRDFYAEIYDLLRSSRVRDQALDLALHQLGRHGNTFLLELVNSERRPLAYHDRHRALEAVAALRENQPLVNRRLNMALDVLQASQSLTPCISYREALEAVVADPDPYFATRVERAPFPYAKSTAPGVRDEAELAACEGLEERRIETLAMLSTLEPQEEDDELANVVILDDEESDTAPGSAEQGRAQSPARP